ncbi:type II toxin-antitoxin system RelE/ParE family toxin [Patescibacteria group bacterium]|nr:type II toxin-antitoxin system RelE/ParE family toxin [Patescibacteria group bacterium]
MPYKLLYTATAAKDIKKLDVIAKKRIGKKIKEYSINPLSTSKRLAHSSIGTYRWRIGNYRIIFDIDNKNIVILRIGHRREIYKL